MQPSVFSNFILSVHFLGGFLCAFLFFLDTVFLMGLFYFRAFSLDVVLGCSELVLHFCVQCEPFLCTYSPNCL